MLVIESEHIICFDVDNTLILPIISAQVVRQTVEILDPYNGQTVLRLPHYPHIKLLKNYVARGAKVIVWSKNGYKWASEVLKALKLDKLNLLVMSKPIAYVDDEITIKWMGEHVYMNADNSFGDGEANL